MRLNRLNGLRPGRLFLKLSEQFFVGCFVWTAGVQPPQIFEAVMSICCDADARRMIGDEEGDECCLSWRLRSCRS